MIGERTIREALGYERAVTEEELTKKAVAPRVTDEQVEAFIVEEHYFTAGDGVDGARSKSWWHQAATPPKQTVHPTLRVMTFCILVLANGFVVHGHSACADPANFNEDIGKRIARANAKAHIWGHLGFELRTRLNMVEQARPASNEDMTTHVGTKVIHAMPMSRGAYNALRGWDLPLDENATDEGYLVEYADGGESNVPGFAGYVSWSPKDVFDRSYGEPLA